MARLKFYLEKRADKSGKCHIKISLFHNGTSARFSTGVNVEPEYWHEGNKETEPHVKRTCDGYKVMNDTIRANFDRIQEEIYRLIQSNSLHTFKTATQLKAFIEDSLYDRDAITFTEYFRECINTYKRQSTSSSYQSALNKINEFTGGKELILEDITVKWLMISMNSCQT